MTTLAQTITVVKGQKVVSTSKQLVNVFKEAKAAYRERKAELKATRTEASQTPGQSPSREPHHPGRRTKESPTSSAKPTFERGYSDSYYVDELGPNQQPTSVRDTRGLASPQYEWSELSRRYSATDAQQTALQPFSGVGTGAAADSEQALADDEQPPPLPPRRMNVENELRMKMFSLNHLLEEANCMQHSARAIVKHLEANPDAMAAVALSLAEISNLLTKMAPGALMTFKGSFPAIVALLLSSEFLIAVGVAAGLTVVALGSYKIIKRIRAKKASTSEPETDELEDVTADLEQIKSWRRGVPEADVQSIGPSADEELATPMASQQLRERLMLTAPEMVYDRSRSTSRERVLEPAHKAQSQDQQKLPSGLRALFKKK